MKYYSYEAFSNRSLPVRWITATLILLAVSIAAQAQDAPVWVSATDGTYSDRVRVTWIAGTNGPTDGFQLYRAVSNNSGMAALIIDYITLTNTYIDDTTATPSQTYYYWMKGFIWGGTSRFFSGFSPSDSGYAAPSGPSIECTSFNSGETATGTVSLTWSSSGLAPSGDVCDIEFSPNGGSYWTGLVSFIDVSAGSYAWNTTLQPDTTQALWRITVWGYSNVTDTCDQLFMIDNTADPAPDAPSSVSASDGTFYGRVEVSWSMVSNVDGYAVYRSTSSNSASASLLQSGIGTTYYSDLSTSAGTMYYYWVKAYMWDPGASQYVYSVYSTSDTGHEKPLPPAPSDVEATDGEFSDRIEITWQMVSNALGYALYRAPTNNSGIATPLTSTWPTTSYSDTNAPAGVTYWYWVKSYDFDPSSTQNVYGAFSAGDDGYANVPPVADLTVTPSNGFAPLRVTLDFSGSYDPNGSIDTVEIDKEGNGVYETSVSTPGEVTVEYTSGGTYNPTVRVTDNNGSKDTASATVTVYGEGPTAVLDLSASSGTAPLAVTFYGTNSSAPAGSEIVVYEWDIEGDGTYESVTTNAQFSWTYGSAGTNYPTLRVTDNNGLQDTDTQVVSVDEPADPPVVTITASTNDGEVAFPVNFSAGVTGGGTITAYKWDFNGDGAYDLSTPSNAVTYTYTAAGIYDASVTVIDDTGLSDMDAVTITARAPVALKVWISQPKSGAALWGQSISLQAETAPGSKTHSVRFEYKRSDEGAWTVLGDYIYPPPYSFSTNWDVTALSDGSNYNLRARARDLNTNEVVSEIITIKVDSGGGTNVGDIVEGVVDGKQQKEQTFSKDETTIVGVADGTRVIVPAGTVGSDTTVKVVLTGQNTNPPSGSASGKAAIDANRNVSIDGDPDLSKAIELTIPYPDEDNDGIVDGTGVPEITLTAHWYDTSENRWRRALATEIYPDENYLKAWTYHLTEFGLFGSKNLLHPANGSILETFTSEVSETNAIQNLTDDNTISFWRSELNPARPQEMVYSFKDDQSALITGAGIYNSGDGSDRFSRSFQILGSINESDYSVLTNGTLAATKDAQIFDFGSVTCRALKLVISDGYTTDAWELAEFELYGDLTPDADNDTLVDAWEVEYFDDLASNSSTNDGDADGLDNGSEQDRGTDPIDWDSDDDRMSDGEEDIAGTSPTNASEVFVISEVEAFGDWSPDILQNGGFEEGWGSTFTLPYWSHNIPEGTIAGSWGEVGVTNSVIHSGTNSATISNKGDSDTIGGWWQQFANPYETGTVWEASAWVYSDSSYTNLQCELKTEFFDSATGHIETVFHLFNPPGETWTHVSNMATSPAGTCFMRFVMVGNGQSSEGSLYFDDCYIGPANQRSWIVRWDSHTGRTYRVYSTDNLIVWTDVVYQVNGSGFEMAYTNSVSDGDSRYMRVTVERE